MPNRSSRALRAAAALVSLAALFVIIYLGWGQLKDAASLHRHWDISWLLIAIAAQIVVYICIAAMFKISLSGEYSSLSFGFLIYCAFAFLFANRSLPGPAVAGVAMLIYLFRGKSISTLNAQAAAGSFYFADYAGFFTLIAAISFPLFVGQHNSAVRLAYLVSLTIILAAAIAALAVFARPYPAASMIAKASSFFSHGLRSTGNAVPETEKVKRAILELHEKMMSATRSPGKLASFYLLSLVMHMAEVATVACGAKAAGITLAVPAAAASYVGGNLASIVSVLPGAIGFYEAGMIGTMHIIGHLAVGDAAVCALTYRVLSFWAPLPAVISVLLRVSRSGISSAGSRKAVNQP